MASTTEILSFVRQLRRQRDWRNYQRFIPYVGNLADKIGRKPPMVIGALVSGLLKEATR